jgi:hypothetical protein
MDDTQQDHHLHVTRINDNQLQTLDSKLIEQDTKLTMQHEHTTALVTKLNQTVNVRVAEQQDILTDLCTDLDRRHTEKSLSQDGKFDLLRNDLLKDHNLFTSQGQQLNTRVETEKVDQARKMERLQTQLSAVMEKSKQSDAEFTAFRKEESEKAAKYAELSKGENEHQDQRNATAFATIAQKLNQTKTDLSESIDTKISNCDTLISEKTDSLNLRLGDLRRSFTEHEQLFKDTSETLNESLLNENKARLAATESDNHRVTTELGRLGQKSDDLEKEHGFVISENLTHLENIYADLLKLVLDKHQQFDAQLGEIGDSARIFQESSLNGTSEIQRSIRDVARVVDERITSVVSDTEDRGRGLAAATERLEKTLAAQIDGVIDNVTAQKAQFSSAISRGEEKAVTLDGQFDVMKQALQFDGKLIADHKTELNQKTAELDQKIGQQIADTVRTIKQTSDQLKAAQTQHQEAVTLEQGRLVKELKMQEQKFDGKLEDGAANIDSRLSRLTSQVISPDLRAHNVPYLYRYG